MPGAPMTEKSPAEGRWTSSGARYQLFDMGVRGLPVDIPPRGGRRSRG